MLLIVGLGNIGKEYERTYHNMGFFVIDAVAKKLNVTVKREECRALTHSFSRFGNRVVIAKPTTYMNLSGEAVKSLAVKYKVDDVIVIYDDIDLPRFSTRARAKGSAGTHNGMRDVVRLMGEDVKRIRMGVGRNQGELKDYVLSRISPDDEKIFLKVADFVADAIIDYIADGDFIRLQQKVNTGIEPIV